MLLIFLYNFTSRGQVKTSGRIVMRHLLLISVIAGVLVGSNVKICNSLTFIAEGTSYMLG